MSAASTRTTAGALLLAATAAIAAPASGSETPAPATRTGAMPSFASLPEGHVPELPTAPAPAAIGASEKVPGFIDRPMPPDQARQMRAARPEIRISYLLADEQMAKAFSQQRGVESTGDVCLVDGGAADSLNGNRSSDDDAEPRDWPSGFTSMIAFQFEIGAAAPAPAHRRSHGKRHVRTADGSEVHAVHEERFVAGGDGRASLEVTDAWFDPRTRGARLIGRSTVPLARVFVGPNGLEVYGARDGEAMQVVLHAPAHPVDDGALGDQLRSRLRNMSVTLPDRGSANGDCGHVRVALRAPAGTGAMMTMQSTAFLPPADDDWGEASERESDEARGSRMLQAMRQRPYQLSVSATTASTDKSPVISIALGWSGREQRGG